MTISDIVNSIYIKTKTNSTSFPAADMLISINNAYDRVASLIMNSDNRWQWDDTNQTDLPIATTDLVSGQQDYSMAVSHLKILRVECAITSAGTTFQKLEPYDQSDESESLTQQATQTGIPYRYDNLGVSLFLDPKPNYNCTAGLKVYFQRGPASFTSGEVTTGTKQPGFTSLYHDLIPLWVAYNYAIDNGLNSANGYLNEIMRKEKELVSDYSSRNREDRSVMTGKKINYI